MRGFFKLILVHPDGREEKTGRVFLNETTAQEGKAFYEKALKGTRINVVQQEICRECGSPNLYDWGMCKSCCAQSPCYNCNLEEKGIDACDSCTVVTGEY